MKNLQERVNEFAESEEFLSYSIKWIQKTHDYFCDAYILGYNLDWVN